MHVKICRSLRQPTGLLEKKIFNRFGSSNLGTKTSSLLPSLDSSRLISYLKFRASAKNAHTFPELIRKQNMLIIFFKFNRNYIKT